MTTDVKQNIKARETWLRGLHIVIFAVIYSIAEIVLAAVVLFQFLSTLFTARKNDRLLEFGDNLSAFIYQILKYLTFNTDHKPFPFDEWPSSDREAEDTGSGDIVKHT
ncbi:MAG: DUF4389 domain-containing protein [Gammaproteobacteria bacterium]|jgi:hypothetical protein